MSDPAISIRHLSKCYQLGTISRHTLVDECRYWWHKMCGRNPAEHMGVVGGHSHAMRKGEFWALDDVSFDVPAGQALGIIGRNGAGKSTLLKVLSRITGPTEGDVYLDGRVGSLLEVGTGFHPELTGRENIYMNGTILGMKNREIDARFDEIVAFAEVEKFLDTPVKRYSSGMYVRLAFAVAAHLDPDILIVDEVLAVGDAEFQKKCIGKMSDVAGHGRTVLFVSHNLSAIRSLCQHAVCLHLGRLVASGPVEKVLADYAKARTLHPSGGDERGRNLLQVRVDVLRDGMPAETLSSGCDADIRFHISPVNVSGKKIEIGMALERVAGEMVMINYSNFHNVSFPVAEGVYTARLKHLPVAAGAYFLHVRVLVDGHEVYWCTRQADVVVEHGDFFGTGRRGEEELCPWLYAVDWSRS